MPQLLGSRLSASEAATHGPKFGRAKSVIAICLLGGPGQHETWNPEAYKDEVQARMRELIAKKVEGQEISIQPEAPAGKVIDLMAALKASLGMTGPDGERKPPIAADVKTDAAAAPPAKKAGKKK